MKAILRHELKSYFSSMTAYVFGAFLLLFVGIGSMLYNLQAAVSNFEFVLSFSSVVFVVIVPVLTMRVIAEERRQKTDQLLYSLPVSTTDIVLGKYIALVAVYILPLLIIAVYPLIFSRFGEVYLPTSYGSLTAFFFMGAALLALGMFLSSVTESQGLAAGLGIAVILFNYFSVSLAEYVSSTAVGSALVLMVLILLGAFVMRKLTGNENLAFALCIVLMLVLCGTMYFNAPALEGLLPDIMRTLSLFDRLETFVNGMFDITALVYFLSVTVFFLFLTVQSLEKRRYN